MIRRSLALLLLCAAACGDGAVTAPDAGLDAGAPPVDAGLDAGLVPEDAGLAPDAGPSLCAGGPCSGPCCEAHDAPGCTDLAVTQCVCAVLPDCCRVWAQDCVDVAVNFQCATCELPGPECGNRACEGEGNETCETCPEDCGACAGPCCEAHAGPGCEDPGITACVCAVEGVCCVGPWDAECVSAVERRGCGTCP